MSLFGFELARLLQWLIVILLIMWVINNPAQGAGLLHNFAHFLGKAGHSLSYIASHS